MLQVKEEQEERSTVLLMKAKQTERIKEVFVLMRISQGFSLYFLKILNPQRHPHDIEWLVVLDERMVEKEGSAKCFED